jgi:hypothetical protein
MAMNENVSLAKSVKLSASLSADIRVEAFNIFNRVLWGTPVTNFSSNTFGQITTQGNNARQMQLGLKLYW